MSNKGRETAERRLVSQLVAAICRRSTWIGCTWIGSTTWLRGAWDGAGVDGGRRLLEVGDAEQRRKKAHGQVARCHLYIQQLQRDARPAVTFPAAEQHRSDQDHFMLIDDRGIFVLTNCLKANAELQTRDLPFKSRVHRPNHYTTDHRIAHNK